MWFINQDKTFAMSCIPKNGHQSFQEFFGTKAVPHEEVLEVPKRVVWLKDPIVRLVSNYSFFKVHNEKGTYKGRPNIQETESWQTFVDFILENDDPHWGSQVEQVTYKGEYLGTVTHKLEDVPKLWGNYFRGFIPDLNIGGHLPYINGIVHEEVTLNYRQNELEEMLAKDIEVYNGMG